MPARSRRPHLTSRAWTPLPNASSAFSLARVSLGLPVALWVPDPWCVNDSSSPVRVACRVCLTVTSRSVLNSCPRPFRACLRPVQGQGWPAASVSPSPPWGHWSMVDILLHPISSVFVSQVSPWKLHPVHIHFVSPFPSKLNLWNEKLYLLSP